VRGEQKTEQQGEQLKMKYSLLTITIISLVLTAATQGAVVYVSESATDLTYSTSTDGTYNGQTGTSGNPFGSLTAAYHYLFTQAGDHTINLIGDDDGTFGGQELGGDRFNNTYGTMEFNSGTGFPTGDPLWNSVTLTGALSPKPITISVTAADITGNTEGAHATYPAAFEKEVPNPGGNNAANRGSVIRGLWNPGASMSMTGMTVEDMTIILGGGHVLVGNAQAGSGEQQFTFNNVDVYLLRDVIDNNPINGLTTGDPWGASVLFTTHVPQADLDNSYLDFNDSNIYLKNDDNSDWGTSNWYVGHTWGSGVGYLLPDNFVDGNSTSGFFYWDGSAYVEYDSSFDIYQSSRNPNDLTEYTLGSTGNDFFALSTFNVSGGAIPEPASLVLMVLAGGAMMMRRRRA
jgi:hypothetical protein